MPVVIEKEDYILVNGKKNSEAIRRKPVDGEDHNIYVYYSSKTGGGSKRLFRKVNDRSSKFYADVNIYAQKAPIFMNPFFQQRY